MDGNAAALALSLGATLGVGAAACCAASQLGGCGVVASTQRAVTSALRDHGPATHLPLTQDEAMEGRLYDILAPEDRLYDVFITHAQTTGQDQAGKLFKMLEAKGLRVWYDMQAQDLTTKGMEEGISKSRTVLVVLTDGFMGRAFCNTELRWAKVYECKLLGVKEEDTRHGQVDFAKEEKSAPEDVKYVLKDVDFVPFRRRAWEENAMMETLLERIGPRPVRRHALCTPPTTVFQNKRDFALGTRDAPGLNSLKGVVYMTGFGSQMQYADVEKAILEAESVLLDREEGPDALWGKHQWGICFGGDKVDRRKPDIGYIVQRLKENNDFLVLAVTNIKVQDKWRGVDDYVDAAFYYDNPPLPNGKIAWGGVVDSKPVGATEIVFDFFPTIRNEKTDGPLEVRFLCVGGGRIAAQEAELAISKGIKTAFVLVPAKIPEAGQCLDGSHNTDPMGPVKQLYHTKCQGLDRRRLWVDQSVRFG